MDYLRQLMSGVTQAWGRLSLSARVNIGVAVVATVALIVLLVVSGNKPNYVNLYSGLSPEDVSKVVDFLKQEGTAYQLADNDTTILVPLSERSRVKLALREKDLPKSFGFSPGYELFDKQDLMTNESLQDIKRSRAVQGELQRHLNQFDFVESSSVFISEAKDELFTSEQKPSKAAVTLKVKRKPSPKEIKAILGTVSSFGGPNLDSNHVTLTTTDGTVLYLPPEDDFAALANSKLEYVSQIEKRAEDRITQAFEKLGVRALIKVSAEIDFSSQVQTTKKTEEGAAVSTYNITTTNTSNEALPQGAPGAMANMPEGGGAGSTKTNEQTEEMIENFEPSHTETKVTKEAGQIRRYRVSAIIEGDYEKKTDAEGKETMTYANLKPETKKKYEDFIQGAVGNAEQPPEISVSDLPFKVDQVATQVATAEAQAAQSRGMMVEYGTKGFQILAVIVCLLVVRSLLRRGVVVPEEEEEEAVARAASLLEPSEEELERQKLMDEVARLTLEEPDTVAALLRSWMAEDED